MLFATGASAQEMEKDFMIGGSMATLADESAMMYNLSFVGSKTFDSNLYAGFGVNAGFGSVDVKTLGVTTTENVGEYGVVA